ncbi:MAG: phage tail assembly protein [Candidatus Promineifilaceae bacterium]
MGIEFTLPRGLIDTSGQIHQTGYMRVALAADEVEPQADPAAQHNEAYLSILVLARVIERIGTLTAITPDLIGSLAASDFIYLQDVYLQLNAVEPSVFQTVCPYCANGFHIQIPRLTGETG